MSSSRSADGAERRRPCSNSLGTQVPSQPSSSKAADWRCPCGEVNFSRRQFVSSSVRRARVEGGPALSKTVFVATLGPETKAPAIKRHFTSTTSGRAMDCSVVRQVQGLCYFMTQQQGGHAMLISDYLRILPLSADGEEGY